MSNSYKDLHSFKPETSSPKKSSVPSDTQNATIINVEAYPECEYPERSKLSPEPVFSPRLKQSRREKVAISQSIEKISDSRPKKTHFNDFLSKMEQFQKSKNEKLIHLQAVKKTQEEEKLNTLPKVKMSEMSKKILEDRKKRNIEGREANHTYSPNPSNEKTLKPSSASTKLITSKVLIEPAQTEGPKLRIPPPPESSEKKSPQKEVQVLGKSEKVLASKLVKEFNSAFEEAGKGKFCLNEKETKALLMKMNFLVGEKGEEKLLSKMWNLVGGEKTGEVSMENLRTFVLGVMNLFLQSMGHSEPATGLGRIIGNRYYMNQEEVLKVHKYFLLFFGNKNSAARKLLDASKPETLNKVEKPEIVVKLEKPDVGVRAGKSEIVVKLEKPGYETMLNKPDDAIKAEKPEIIIKLGKSDNAAKIDKPENVNKVDNPERINKFEKKTEKFKEKTDKKVEKTDKKVEKTDKKVEKIDKKEEKLENHSIQEPTKVRIKEHQTYKTGNKHFPQGKLENSKDLKVSQVHSVKSIAKSDRDSCMTPKSRRQIDNLNTSFRSARSKSRSRMGQDSARSSMSESDWAGLNNDKISDPSILLKAQDLLGAFSSKIKKPEPQIKSKKSAEMEPKMMKKVEKVENLEASTSSKLLYKKNLGFKSANTKGIDDELKRANEMLKGNSRSPAKGGDDIVIEVSMPDGTQKTLIVPMKSNHQLLVQKFVNENSLTNEMGDILLNSIGGG